MLQSLLAKISLRYPWIATPFLLCGGCNLFAETTTPMPLDIHGDPASAEQVVVLLPGIRDRGDTFLEAGFIEDARPQIDNGRLAIIIADAHVGYYRERSVTERLVADILQRWPERRFILAGVSLGGFGSLTVARTHPQRIESLLLLAPFLGEKPLLPRLAARDYGQRPEDDELNQELLAIWQFLLSPQAPSMTLTYGENDSFRPFYEVLQTQRPNLKIMTTDGGHDWDSWRTLWQRWLSQHNDP